MHEFALGMAVERGERYLAPHPCRSRVAAAARVETGARTRSESSHRASRLRRNCWFLGWSIGSRPNNATTIPSSVVTCF